MNSSSSLPAFISASTQKPNTDVKQRDDMQTDAAEQRKRHKKDKEAEEAVTHVHLYLLSLKVQAGFSVRGNKGSGLYWADTRKHTVYVSDKVNRI